VIDRREQQRVVPGGDGRFADRLDDPTVVEREVGTVVFGRTDGDDVVAPSSAASSISGDVKFVVATGCRAVVTTHPASPCSHTTTWQSTRARA